MVLLFLDIFLLFIFYNIILLLIGLFFKVTVYNRIFVFSLYTKLYIIIMLIIFFIFFFFSFYKLIVFYQYYLIIPYILNLFFFVLIVFFILLFLFFFFFINYYYRRILPFVFCLNFLLFSNVLYLFIEDFFSFYIVLEFQTLLMYVLYNITLNSYSSFYIKNGIRFFILSIFTSLFFLIGIFFIYYSSGTIVFFELNYIFNNNFNKFFNLGINLIYGVLCFKLGLFPFYLWMLEVFGILNNIFFILYIFLSKIPVFIVFIKLILFFNVTTILFVISIFSVVFGTINILIENDFRLFIIYSSMVQYGVFFLCLVSKNIYIYYGIFYSYLNYLLIFSFLFYIIFVVGNNTKYNFNIFNNLKYLSFLFSIIIIVLLFSIIGVPPSLGFLGKYYIYYGLLVSDFFFITVFLIFMNLFSSVYYFNIIRLLYFQTIKDAGIFTYSFSFFFFFLWFFISIIYFIFLFYYLVFFFFLCI